MPFTADYLSRLKAAIDADPGCAPYAHSNDMPKIDGAEAFAKDSAIANRLNALGAFAGHRQVATSEAKKLLIRRGKWRGLVEAAASTVPSAAREAARAAVDMADDERMTIDTLDAEATPMVAALVSAGLLSAADRAALEDLCRTPSAVTADEVSRALRGPWE